MNPKKSESPLDRFFTLRNISNFIMMAAIVVTLIPGKTSLVERSQAFQDLENRNVHFILKIAYAKIAGQKDVSAEEKKMLLMENDLYFSALEKQSEQDQERIGLEKTIMEIYMGRIQDRPDFKSTDPIYEEFRKLYYKKEPLPDDALLFSLESGNLARLRSLELAGKTGEMEALESSIRLQTGILVAVLVGLSLAGFALFLGSFALGVTFYTRKPKPVLEASLQKISNEQIVHFFDAGLLFLFLAFPVSRFLVYLLPETTPFVGILAISPIFFLLVLILFYSGTGVSPRSIYLPEKISHVFKEFLWGILGFVGIFPIAITTTLTVINLFGVDAGNARFAHPIVFQVSDHPVALFVFAVFIVPIIEETVFRYWLFSYFRKYTGAVLSSFVTGTFFAVLHPQGWVALPYLTILGMGLAMLREYRGNMIPSIVAHGIVNAMAMGGTYLFFQFTSF